MSVKVYPKLRLADRAVIARALPAVTLCHRTDTGNFPLTRSRGSAEILNKGRLSVKRFVRVKEYAGRVPPAA